MNYNTVIGLSFLVFSLNSHAAKGVIGTLLGGLIGGTVGNAVGTESHKKRVDESLTKIVKKTNESLPKFIDKVTRWDSISAEVGQKVTFYYTATTISSNDVPDQVFRQNFAPTLHKEACLNKDLKDLYENGVTLTFSYKGNDGLNLGRVTMTPKQCGFA